MAERRVSSLLLLALGTTVVLLVGVGLVESRLSHRADRARQGDERRAGPTLVSGADRCATCHQQTTPGIVTQHLDSAHARSGLGCAACHEADADRPLAREHHGTWVVTSPTPRTCGSCHQRETREFLRSRHALPAWAALSGTDDFTPEQRAQYDSIEEVVKTPIGIGVSTRNALYDIEGPLATPAACESCHAVGRPNADGSVGSCTSCHLRHRFSLEQARKPETCNGCHIGPDHPQWEIFQHSKHGVAYLTSGHTWNWSVPSGRITPVDIPAATCALCHMSGFGSQGTTHDVGDRLSLYLFMPMSQWRPNAEENRQRMQDVCLACHSLDFVQAAYARGDAVTAQVTAIEKQAAAIMSRLENGRLLSREPFDHPLKFEAFELWHHWGRTAKFGAFMFGADYTQWHGVYEMLSAFTSIAEEAEAIERAGVLQDPVDWPLRKRTPLAERLKQWHTGRILPPGREELPPMRPGGDQLIVPEQIPTRVEGTKNGR